MESESSMSEWISVKDKLPTDTFNVIVWIPNQTPRGGYWDLASYGEWFCEDEDCHPGDPGYVADNDKGNRRGFGWHREEETHGGPYDYVTIDLNSRVTHWMPLPEPPK